ncbi:hypothetical protein ACX48J_003740, partial [Acinetobacter baumannii]
VVSNFEEAMQKAKVLWETRNLSNLNS